MSKSITLCTNLLLFLIVRFKWIIYFENGNVFKRVSNNLHMSHEKHFVEQELCKKHSDLDFRREWRHENLIFELRNFVQKLTEEVNLSFAKRIYFGFTRKPININKVQTRANFTVFKAEDLITNGDKIGRNNIA